MSLDNFISLTDKDKIWLFFQKFYETKNKSRDVFRSLQLPGTELIFHPSTHTSTYLSSLKKYRLQCCFENVFQRRQKNNSIFAAVTF